MTRNKYWILDHFCVNPLNSFPLFSLLQESKKALPKTKTKKILTLTLLSIYSTNVWTHQAKMPYSWSPLCSERWQPFWICRSHTFSLFYFFFISVTPLLSPLSSSIVNPRWTGEKYPRLATHGSCHHLEEPGLTRKSRIALGEKKTRKKEEKKKTTP